MRRVPVTFYVTLEQRKWLEVARRAGFSMSQVLNILISGQPDLEMQVRWMIDRKIRDNPHEQGRLQDLLDCAGYPVGYY